MDIQCLHEKAAIEKRLRGNTYLHIYSIGDLDDFYWPYTTWYTDSFNHKDSPVVLIYTGSKLPVILALTERIDAMCRLLHALMPVLPYRFYAHLSPGLAPVFNTMAVKEFHGSYLKMGLIDTSAVMSEDTSGTCELGIRDAEELVEFYKKSYPENWFDSRILETGRYYGLRDKGELIGTAGVHVFSKRYQVAALGSIAVMPSNRNRGYGKRVTARTCQSLLEDISHIGLNVRSDNKHALSCYNRLGFKPIGEYEEYFIHLNNFSSNL